LIIGSALFLYCSNIFKLVGKGTPVPLEPPQKIVQQGLYKYVRNPMYLGYFALVFGIALIVGSTLLYAYAVIFTVATHFYVVIFEEPRLRRRFGSSYRLFTEQTPRWLPKLN
jgi:protein-S-isoprenylcysteine O-methyltransferase Ste14